MASSVAKSASVDSRARLSQDVAIGPGCVIGPEVEIGRGTRLVGHICLMGAVKLGEFNTIGPFVAIGGAPQDLSYWGKTTRVQIGNHNVIGERVTIHRASEKEDGVTNIGSNNQFLEARISPTTASWVTGSRWAWDRCSAAMSASSAT